MADKKHTPGPWGWFGSAQHGFYLATQNRGRIFVMDFGRMGMRGGQPRFQVDGRMVKGQELVRFEVDQSVVGFTAGRQAPSVYRFDICDIDHPDARLIAAAPQTAAERDRLAQEVERLREALNTAYGKINALGGSKASNDFDSGINHAVDQSLLILEELGAVDPILEHGPDWAVRRKD